MNESIVETFVGFYYAQLNKKTMEHVAPHLKEFSIYVRDDVKFQGKERILNALRASDVLFEPKKINILINGERRANVVVSGLLNGRHPFCEYIHLAYGNDKSYWVHSSILQMV